MMSKKSPQLRFEGFTDDWEERKLSSISERVTRKNKNNESTLPLTISAQDGLIDQNDFFNKQVASRDVTGYFLVKNGEFAYNKSYSNGYPWGAIKRLDKYDMGVLSTLYIVFRPTEINSQFLVSYYDTTRWYREVSKNAAEGARNHGLLNIAPTDFFNTLLVVPKIVDEQEKIGSFFKQMDNTIALHQRKLDLLKEQKKGYLQKMFPKNGEKVPELRFAGFADDWELRKLNEVSDIYDGTHQTPKYQDDGVMFLSVENIKTLTSNKFISREAFEVEFKIRPQRGDVLMTRIGDIGTANVVETDEDLAYYVSLALFKSEELNPYFLQASIYAPFVQDQIWKRTLHIAFPKKINKNEIGQVPINVPTLAEQTKIGSFFKQLDNTITLHQRKLEKLKNLKKALLNELFV